MAAAGVNGESVAVLNIEGGDDTRPRELAATPSTGRYGLSWQVVPTGMEELLADPDPKRAERAMQAMLGTGKLDIAALRSAPTASPRADPGRCVTAQSPEPAARGPMRLSTATRSGRRRRTTAKPGAARPPRRRSGPRTILR